MGSKVVQVLGRQDVMEEKENKGSVPEIQVSVIESMESGTFLQNQAKERLVLNSKPPARRPGILQLILSQYKQYYRTNQPNLLFTQMRIPLV